MAHAFCMGESASRQLAASASSHSQLTVCPQQGKSPRAQKPQAWLPAGTVQREPVGCTLGASRESPKGILVQEAGGVEVEPRDLLPAEPRDGYRANTYC
jgi:hypothetical protein